MRIWGKRKRPWRRWLWLALGLTLTVGVAVGIGLCRRTQRQNEIWPPAPWVEGFSYWGLLDLPDEAPEQWDAILAEFFRRDRLEPVQLTSLAEAEAFNEAFGALGLEPLGEHNFEASWLWVAGTMKILELETEEARDGLRVFPKFDRHWATEDGEEYMMGAVESGLVVYETPKVELTY